MPAKERVPDEIKKICRDLWMQGYSSHYIGDKIGKTRRAVIGIVNRLGLMRVERPGNPAPAPNVRGRRQDPYRGRQTVKPLKAILGHKRSDGEPVSIKDIPMPEPSVAAKNGYRRDGKLIDLMDLHWNSCRWPVGDPLDPKFGYCGAQTHPPCPYCVIHKKIAYYTAARVR